MSDDTSFTPRDAEPKSIEDKIGAVTQLAKPRKRIVTTVTIHAAGPEHVPFVHSDSGRILSGQYHSIEYAPGWPVELDAVEAERILARHGGEEVGPDYEIPAGTPQPVETKRVE